MGRATLCTSSQDKSSYVNGRGQEGGPEPLKNDKKTCNFANSVHLINSSCPLLFPPEQAVYIPGPVYAMFVMMVGVVGIQSHMIIMPVMTSQGWGVVGGIRQYSNHGSQ